MAVSLEEYKRLRQKVDERKTKADRAEGAYDEAMKRLKALGYDSIEGAEEVLAGLRKELAVAEEAYEKELVAFKVKWEGKLE